MLSAATISRTARRRPWWSVVAYSWPKAWVNECTVRPTASYRVHTARSECMQFCNESTIRNADQEDSEIFTLQNVFTSFRRMIAADVGLVNPAGALICLCRTADSLRYVSECNNWLHRTVPGHWAWTWTLRPSLTSTVHMLLWSAIKMKCHAVGVD